MSKVNEMLDDINGEIEGTKFSKSKQYVDIRNFV